MQWKTKLILKPNSNFGHICKLIMPFTWYFLNNHAGIACISLYSLSGLYISEKLSGEIFPAWSKFRLCCWYIFIYTPWSSTCVNNFYIFLCNLFLDSWEKNSCGCTNTFQIGPSYTQERMPDRGFMAYVRGFVSRILQAADAAACAVCYRHHGW